jgi:hypothetical protein
MVSFADRVRIKVSAETERLGLAGREGQVFGETIPSEMGVYVVGPQADDYAINVHFDELNDSYWFSEELLEVIDSGAGTVASLDGDDTEWVRQASGEWTPQPRSR